MIRIGRIVRPHGIRGALAVTLDDPESESLYGVRYVHLRSAGETRRVDVRRTGPGRKGQVLLQLAGVETPEAAELLRDREVLLEEDQLPKLGAGEFWHRDLLTLMAVDSNGAELGPVAEVVDTADVPVLVVKAKAGELFVPFTESFVVEVDLRGRRVVVSPPELAE